MNYAANPSSCFARGQRANLSLFPPSQRTEPTHSRSWHDHPRQINRHCPSYHYRLCPAASNDAIALRTHWEKVAKEALHPTRWFPLSHPKRLLELCLDQWRVTFSRQNVTVPKAGWSLVGGLLPYNDADVSCNPGCGNIFASHSIYDRWWSSRSRGNHNECWQRTRHQKRYNNTLQVMKSALNREWIFRLAR